MPFKINGYALMSIMAKREVSAMELVRLTGIARKTIYNYRAGKGGQFANIMRIAEALDCDPREFVDGFDQDDGDE